MTIPLATVFVAGVPMQMKAHDFWLQPTNFQIETGVERPVDILIGHQDDISPWPLAPDRVISLRLTGPTATFDQMEFYESADRQISVRANEAGLHWVSITTQDAVSTLPAERFEDYIKEEGLRLIQQDRLTTRTTENPGIERYSRRGKALIAVGDWRNAPSEHVMRPLGLTLEIIPTVNPYAVAAGAPMTLEVRYRGKVVPGARMKIISLDRTEPSKSARADANGVVSVERPESGVWMYHVVWGTPLPDRADEDYDSIFSSLTFDAGL